MNPDSALERIRVEYVHLLSTATEQVVSDGGTIESLQCVASSARELAEAIESLDLWLSSGGALPTKWDGR